MLTHAWHYPDILSPFIPVNGHTHLLSCFTSHDTHLARTTQSSYAPLPSPIPLQPSPSHPHLCPKLTASLHKTRSKFIVPPNLATSHRPPHDILKQPGGSVSVKMRQKNPGKRVRFGVLTRQNVRAGAWQCTCSSRAAKAGAHRADRRQGDVQHLAVSGLVGGLQHIRQQAAFFRPNRHQYKPY